MSVDIVRGLVLLCGVLSVVVSDEVIFGYEEGANNLMPNWDFEDDLSLYPDVSCPGCSMETSFDARTGNKSVRIYARSKPNKGLRHRIYGLETNKRYYVSQFIKWLNDANDGTPFSVSLTRIFKKSAGGRSSKQISILPFSRQGSLWVHVGVDFLVDVDVDYVDFLLKSPPTEIEYLVDSVSLIELPPDPNWRDAANDRIQQYRKGSITVTADVDATLDPALVDIEVQQQRHHFGFGASISADVFNAEGVFNDNYRHFFYDNFEWSVMENDMKWKSMEGTKYQIKYDRIDTALAALEANGIKMRGHNIFWNKKENNPTWLQDLEGEDMMVELRRRLVTLIPYYHGRMEHWDVYNEQMSDHFLEGATGNNDLVFEVFENVSRYDPNATLYLNEYAILRETGTYNAEIVNLAEYLLQNGAKLGGIGMQSHQHDLSITMESLKKRLDIVSTSGCDLWITELSVHATNVTKRAIYLEDFVRMYFSTPAIGGINLWGFSDWQIFEDDCCLAEGEGVVPNEAGLAWHRLVKEEWWTDETVVPTSGDFMTNFTAFYGNYNASLYYDGQLLDEDDFYISPGQQVTLDVYVDTTSSGITIGIQP